MKHSYHDWLISLITRLPIPIKTIATSKQNHCQAKFSNVVYSFKKAILTTPVGPFRCLPIMSSLIPLSAVSGLGLSIAKHIMEAHGEQIFVKSKYLRGSEFSFTLENVENF